MFVDADNVSQVTADGVLLIAQDDVAAEESRSGKWRI
jgi:hypothetical protein